MADQITQPPQEGPTIIEPRNIAQVLSNETLNQLLPDAPSSETAESASPPSPPSTTSPPSTSASADMPEPIAIVGMAMRLPAGVRSGNDFWKLLDERRGGLCDVPADRYNIAGFYDPSGKAGTLPMNKGYYLSDFAIQDFDASFFSLSKTELERLDPSQRQLLEVAYECMEDSGSTGWRGTDIGCYVGVFGEDWQDLNAKETQHRGGYRVTGYGDFVLGNRVSYEYDLHGPSMTVKTGCSSSLVGLDMACEAIRKGDCTGALVCGTSLIFSPTMALALQDQGVLSPTGTCKSFDAKADGYARGEAVNAIYVKRLSDALKDGDNIRAVIRGTSVNDDGRTNGMLIPSSVAQEALIRRAYKQAGINDLSKTAMVECHGTGTKVGDPLEVRAVANCFGADGMIITSVKPNVGHSEGAAGLTSLIKAVLALERRQVPPNINFDTPNPDIPFKECNLRVPVTTEEWPAGRAERVSVNSFGIGGVNAHVICDTLQQYNKDMAEEVPATSLSGASQPKPIFRDTLKLVRSQFDRMLSCDSSVTGKSTTDEDSESNGKPEDSASSNTSDDESQDAAEDASSGLPELLLFSAHNSASLDSSIDSYVDLLTGDGRGGVSLRDIAYTLATRRDHKSHRAYTIATGDGAGSGKVSLETSTTDEAGEAPPIAWIFTGQGAQWPEMGAQLIDTNPVFSSTIRQLDAFLLGLPEPPPWTIEGELRKIAGDSRVAKAELGHPLSIAVQIGLIDVLHSWGIKPDFVLGHSSGEMSAAYASGSITAEGAMAAATFRGTTSGDETGGKQRGSMAAIGLGPSEMEPYMESGVVIACENSQLSVTISGDAEQVDKVVKNVKRERPGVLARALKVEKAFHSHHMKESGPLYEQHIQPFITSVDPVIPFYSSVTGKQLTGDGCLGAHYWRANMESPVLFNTALRSALADFKQRMLLVEIGPHPALKGPVGQILRDLERSNDVIHMGTLQRNVGCHESLLRLGGELFKEKVALDMPALFPSSGRRHVSNLPRYGWKHSSAHWAESRIAREWRFREHPPHDLLGSRAVEVTNEPCWRQKLALEDVPWLSGHQVNGEIVYPAAAYIGMIGEALRQLEGGEKTYSLKDVSITTGLILNHDKVAELVTKLNPLAQDSSDDSPWYAFSISSYDGSRWVKHCTGEARASVGKAVSLEAPSQVARWERDVDANEWYKILGRVGFNYTGLFRGLQNITSSTTEKQSSATISPIRGDDEHKYTLHPATIDHVFQLFTVSASRGLGRNCTNIAVPTFIKEIVVSPPPANASLDVTADMNWEDRGSFAGDLYAYADGKVLLSLKGFKASAMTSGDALDAKAPLVIEIDWKPHVEFTSLQERMVPQTEPRENDFVMLEQLMILCMQDHAENIKIADDTATHLVKFFTWMQEMLTKYKSGSLVNAISSTSSVSNKSLWELSTTERRAEIESLAARINQGKWAPVCTAIHRLYASAQTIFTGESHPLHILMEDDVLTEFYSVGEALEYDAAIQAMAHSNPRLRVLEVGAGTGGTTAKVLDGLYSEQGENMYASYTFTDISMGFMDAAEKRFGDKANMVYAALDAGRDPVEQGFAEGGYDLIIASNIVHATPSLNTTLTNLRRLLSPNGYLFLHELCPDLKFVNYVMGFLPGWWLGDQDNRPDEPYVHKARWEQELVAAGFNKPSAFVRDATDGFHLNAGILASPAIQPPKSTTKNVTVLCHDAAGPLVAELTTTLEKQGLVADVCIFGQVEDLPRGQDVISLLEVQDLVVFNFTKDTFQSILKHFNDLNGNRMLWITRSAQVGCKDPNSAITVGLMRTARNELSAKLYTVEVDMDDQETSRQDTTDALVDILSWSKSVKAEYEGIDPDWELAVIKGQVMVPRFHWNQMSAAFERSAKKAQQGSSSVSKDLTIKTPGLLHTMGWAEGHVNKPGPKEVLVETRAVGLNFRDVLIALGVLDNSTKEIGLEGCGVVSQLGSDVQGLSVGDRVMYMSGGCFTTHLILPAVLCVKIDESITFEQGAGLPCVFATAAMALTDKANLQAGQSILIHSACGGVGLAAIQIAQMLGAEIFCTVGSQEKIDYLMTNHNIPRDHIFNSRDDSFLKDLMKVTDNRGADIVLNSLAGQLLQASWACVAEFGTMIEIGKRDFRRRAKLSLEAFEQNRTFVGLDLWQVSQVRPEKAAQLLQKCVGWISQGLIKPGVIAKQWEPEQLQEAFRFMQSGKHIGKIIVKMPTDASLLQANAATTATPLPNFREDRSYLLVGGLGGLGRSVATWMVENGARNIVFMSRSADTSKDPQLARYVEELTSQGCEVQIALGSVDVMADVEKALKTASRPVAGVINLSMVLRDVSLNEMSFDDWTAAISPKVQGTWNLHNAITWDLDFFILCSSYSGIVGQWGQGNYAAANTFLDAFVQYRHSQGQSASVIDIGVMGEIGFVSKNKEIIELFEKAGMLFLKETDLLDAFNLAIQRSAPQPVSATAQATGHGGELSFLNDSQILLGLNTTFPLASPNTRSVWKRDARAAIYHNINSVTQTVNIRKDDGGLRSLVAAAMERPDLLQEESTMEAFAGGMAQALADFLIKDVANLRVDHSLEQLGVDSLVAMELRNWIFSEFAVQVSVMIIIQSQSLLKLAESIRTAMEQGTKA